MDTDISFTFWNHRAKSLPIARGMRGASHSFIVRVLGRGGHEKLGVADVPLCKWQPVHRNMVQERISHLTLFQEN